MQVRAAVKTVELDDPRDGRALAEIEATGICHTGQYTLAVPVVAKCTRASPELTSGVGLLRSSSRRVMLRAVVPVAEQLSCVST
jgi:hypothetical protein